MRKQNSDTISLSSVTIWHLCLGSDSFQLSSSCWGLVRGSQRYVAIGRLCPRFHPAVLFQDDEAKPASKSDLKIVFLNVISTVQARFATTLITSQVANKANTAKEITFTAQLPEAAFISNFSM